MFSIRRLHNISYSIAPKVIPSNFSGKYYLHEFNLISLNKDFFSSYLEMKRLHAKDKVDGIVRGAIVCSHLLRRRFSSTYFIVVDGCRVNSAFEESQLSMYAVMGKW
jgi:hypothetical protein